MAGLIAMISVFVVVTIEMTFSTMNGGSMGSCHAGPALPGGYEALEGVRGHSRGGSLTVPVVVEPRGHRRSGSIGTQLQKIERAGLPEGEGSDAVESESESEGNEAEETAALNGGSGRGRPRGFSGSSEGRGRGGGRLTEEQQRQKELLQVMLLEAGILFHSVFIGMFTSFLCVYSKAVSFYTELIFMILIYTAGMALSVATGSNFIVLLIAITFHQTFEGLALGSRIASLTVFSTNSYKPWLMCLAYGTTTPIGQAIGLATRKLYDPASQQGLLMVGVMNAISSGLLLFAGLVELLAEDFLSDESYFVLKGRRRVQAGVAVVAGALGMALIGAWVSFLIIGL